MQCVKNWFICFVTTRFVLVMGRARKLSRERRTSAQSLPTADKHRSGESELDLLYL
jgi:hypothetical protein